MRFILQENAPYLISGGRAYPVKITEDNTVHIDRDHGFETEKQGYMTLREVVAKVGYSNEEQQEEVQEQRQEEILEPKRGRKKAQE